MKKAVEKTGSGNTRTGEALGPTVFRYSTARPITPRVMSPAIINKAWRSRAVRQNSIKMIMAKLSGKLNSK
jgi:hypothetical protein